MTPELSVAFRTKQRRADEAIAEYHAQQQIICLLLKRLGGSVTLGEIELVTQCQGKILVSRDPDTGATTIHYTEHHDA